MKDSPHTSPLPNKLYTYSTEFWNQQTKLMERLGSVVFKDLMSTIKSFEEKKGKIFHGIKRGETEFELNTGRLLIAKVKKNNEIDFFIKGASFNGGAFKKGANAPTKVTLVASNCPENLNPKKGTQDQKNIQQLKKKVVNRMNDCYEVLLNAYLRLMAQKGFDLSLMNVPTSISYVDSPDKENQFMVMAKKSASNVTKAIPKLTRRESLYVTWQMAEAIALCQILGIVHRDTKSDNFLIRRNKVTNQLEVKLNDFGLSSLQMYCRKTLPRSSGPLLTTAPEMQDDRYSTYMFASETDIPGLALAIIQVLLKQSQSAFEQDFWCEADLKGCTTKQLREKIYDWKKNFDKLSSIKFKNLNLKYPKLVTILSRALSFEPENRPSARKLAGHLKKLYETKYRSLELPAPAIARKEPGRRKRRHRQNNT
jgi:serine/threonine protein kinase